MMEKENQETPISQADRTEREKHPEHMGDGDGGQRDTRRDADGGQLLHEKRS